MSETKPRRVVGRGVAIGLGVICVLLLAGIGGAMAYYTMKINDRDTEIASINAQLAAITGNNTNVNATELINQLNANITNLADEKNQLQACLDGNLTAYNSLQSTYTDYVNSHSHTNAEYQSLQTQIASLQNEVDDLNSQIQSKNAQIASLQNQLADLQAPKLIKVNLKSDDNRPWLGTPYLHVYGEICNVGTNTAYNCKLHVVAYQSGGVVAIDTYILLGSISGQSWVSVDGSPTYSGGALTGWSVTPEWTS